MRYDVLALGIVFAAILIGMQRWQSLRTRRRRAAMFRDVLDLFDSYRVTQEGSDFPRLEGRRGSHSFRLELVADTLGLRKLPPLWLLVTLRATLPWQGSLDLLMRPQNTETWSPSARLGHVLPVPAAWPQHMAIHTNRPEEIPALDLVGRHVGLFADPRAKELLIAPGGVRIVYQIDQARSAHYMVLRQAEFESETVDRDTLAELLDRAVTIHRDLVRSDAQADGAPVPEPARIEPLRAKPVAVEPARPGSAHVVAQ